MRTIKTIYLTTIHLMLAAAIFLYTSESYTLAKIEPQTVQGTRYNSDEWYALAIAESGKDAKHTVGRK